jgi:hypothetical protein
MPLDIGVGSGKSCVPDPAEPLLQLDDNGYYWFLVPLLGELPADPVSSWVDVVGPWTGSVVLSTGAQTAAELTRALLGDYAPELLEHEDVADAFGEIANVVGGNVKAALPGPSALSLPEVGNPPALRNPADVVRIDVLWRGQPVSISVQGALPPLPVAHS